MLFSLRMPHIAFSGSCFLSMKRRWLFIWIRIFCTFVLAFYAKFHSFEPIQRISATHCASLDIVLQRVRLAVNISCQGIPHRSARRASRYAPQVSQNNWRNWNLSRWINIYKRVVIGILVNIQSPRICPADPPVYTCQCPAHSPGSSSGAAPFPHQSTGPAISG